MIDNIETKTRILVDAHIFDHSFQGTATYLYGLYTELVKHNDLEITLCASDIENLKKIFPDSKFKFIALPKGSRIKRLFQDFPKIIRQGKYDYAHFQYIVPFIKTCKFINTIHDVLFLDFKKYFPWSYRVSRRILFKFSAIRSDIILSVSEYSKKDLAVKLGVNIKKIIVTPNAVNRYAKAQIDIKKKYELRKFILFVSRFEPRKNHIGLLKAYLSQKLYSKGYDLVFIGSKKEKIEFQAYNELLSIITSESKAHIHFLEGIPFKELDAFYQQASLFVFPSFAEGFGIPPIEAAVNGCKVLCSNQTAMSDFSFFKYGFNPNNQFDLEEQLIPILMDNEYPTENIREEIQFRYNWTTIANNLHKTLKPALE